MTAARKRRFLEELARHGIVVEAARAVSPGADPCRGAVRSFQDERNRDAHFSAQWDEALELGVAALEREAHRRAVEGWVERGVFDKTGRRVGDVVRYSDRLLEVMLKARRPEYRDRVDVSAQTTVHARVDVRLSALVREMTREERDEMRQLLAGFRRLQERVEQRLALVGRTVGGELPTGDEVAEAREVMDVRKASH